EFADKINHGLVRLAILCAEARNDVPEVRLVELCVFIDLSRQESFPQRAERNKPNAEFFQRRHDSRLWLSPPQRIFALQRRHRLNRMRSANRLHARFRQSKMLYLSFANQTFNCTSNVFDRYIRINPVLIQQINHIGLQSLKGSLDHFLDVLRPAIQASLSAFGIELECKLGGDHHLLAERCDGFAQKLLVLVRTVSLGGVEKCHTTFERSSNERDSRFLLHGWPITEAQPHAAESDR